jgi:hypothetical protein
MRKELSRLEKQLEKLVEGSLARVFGAGLSASEMGARLARAMDDGVIRDEKGRAHAPDQFALTLHPAEIEQLSEKFSDIIPELSKACWRRRATPATCWDRRSDARLRPDAVAEVASRGLA